MNAHQIRRWEREARTYRCECGEMCNPMSQDWRWEGSYWAHYHGYPIGHVPAQRLTFWQRVKLALTAL